MDLVGREADLAALDRMVSGVGNGGCALVVRGEPGAGKSALLAELDSRVTGAGRQVLRTEGVPPEQRLPLAGLLKLLRPVLSEARRLRPAEQEALERAFGLRRR
jgi:predicted ATPase